MNSSSNLMSFFFTIFPLSKLFYLLTSHLISFSYFPPYFHRFLSWLTFSSNSHLLHLLSQQKTAPKKKNSKAPDPIHQSPTDLTDLFSALRRSGDNEHLELVPKDVEDEGEG